MAVEGQQQQQQEMQQAGVGALAPAPAAIVDQAAQLQAEMRENMNQMRRELLHQSHERNSVYQTSYRLEHSCPDMLRFLFGVFGTLYAKALAASSLMEGVKELHGDIPAAISDLSHIVRSLQAFRAAFDAAGKCKQHHYEVFEGVYEALGSNVSEPSDEVFSGKERLYDLKPKTFTAVTNQVRDWKNSHPMKAGEPSRPKPQQQQQQQPQQQRQARFEPYPANGQHRHQGGGGPARGGRGNY